MKRVSFLTLGCKVNQYDTDAMRGLFIRAGYEVVGTHEAADVCVINTCSVTHVGERKSRQAIRKMRRLNPDTIIAVTGCYAQLDPDAIAGIEGVRVIVGTQDRHRIVDFVESCCDDGSVQNHVREILPTTDFENLNLYGGAVEHTRAYVKIQEGCGNFCTFCIIPYTRGRLKSRRGEDIYAETLRLTDQGYKEIILTGIHLGNYGQDLGQGHTLADVVKMLLKTTDIRRIRLGSIESVELSDELIALLADEPRLCPHLHLPIQSGSERVLRMMRRHYHLSDYLALIDDLRQRVPNIALTTDLILGFPGETEEMFQETLATLESVGFADVHVFPYSRRQGTPAAEFPNQVSEAEKKERVHRALETVRNAAASYRQSFIGTDVDVLVESRLKNGRFEGMSAHYHRVQLLNEVPATGEIYSAHVVDEDQNGLIGVAQVKEEESI